MYDLLVRAARIVDGSGRPAFVGDIGVVGGRIAALGANLAGDAQCELDATNQVVAPGFVDAHTHDDLVVLRQHVAVPKVHQGVTTLVIGNCGFSIAPSVPEHMHEMQSYAAAVLGSDEESWDWPTMGAFLETLQTQAFGQHVRVLLGHTALRVAVMGFEPRPASEQEMLSQEALVAEAMQAGAAGLSLGLMYIPGMYAPQTELLRLARVVSRYGGVVTAHMRGEGDQMLASLDEMIALAQQAEVAVHISHLKIIGRRNWGSINQALERIVDARARGLSITVDMYPYTAGSTTITQILPPWLLAGGLAQTLHSLHDPDVRQRICHDFAHGLPGWENQVEMLGWERIVLASMQQEEYRALEGLSIAEAATRLNLTPEETLFRLLLAEEGRITIVVFSMDEHDVDQVIQSSFAMIGSDGLPLRSGRPHPRLYGTFPRYLRRYVRDLKSLSLEAAIHKITAFPAARFGLTDQGLIREQNVADMVIFDPDSIGDRATYSVPQTYPHGISAVIVAGQPIVLANQLQAQLPGHLIRADGRDMLAH